MSTTAAERAQAGPVRVERAGAVATVVLARAEAMNALDTATKDALLAALGSVAQDGEVRCVVLTGSGRAFCVGQDLREHAELLGRDDPALWDTVARHYTPIVELIATMDKPVLAAVNGVAAGAGAGFALAADLRLVSDTAGFNLAFAGIALSCDSGTSWTLQRLVGPARAKELLMLPRTVTAQEALELGLATRVVPAHELAGQAASLAAELASGPTLAYGSIRRSVAFAAGRDLMASLTYEGEQMARTGATADHHQAVEAFIAKRRPTFTGS